MNNVGLKEKSIIFLIFIFVIYLSYTQINKENKVNKTEKIIKEEPKKVQIKTSEKKEQFKKIFVPAITEVYTKRYNYFQEIKL